MSRQGGGYFGARPFGVAGRLCGAAGVPGAVGPGRCVCRCAAARPLAVRAASFARRVVSKPGQAPPPSTGTAARPSGPSGALHSRLLSLTGAAGNSRETINTSAGVCSVSGETDDTIASQIHLFSAQFWRRKESWVSWRRPDVSALVSTVSSCGAVSSMGATKFAQRGQNGPK